jgi:hypothetical protein
MALTMSQAYQDATDAPSTLKAYAADLAHYKAWCDRRGFVAMPAMPEVVGAYLAAAGEGYAMPTLRRRVATIARACGVAGHPLDSKHPAIRETLRGIGRKHGSPARRAAALKDRESLEHGSSLARKQVVNNDMRAKGLANHATWPLYHTLDKRQTGCKRATNSSCTSAVCWSLCA